VDKTRLAGDSQANTGTSLPAIFGVSVGVGVVEPAIALPEEGATPLAAGLRQRSERRREKAFRNPDFSERLVGIARARCGTRLAGPCPRCGVRNAIIL
jgi:hypothetical protein